MSAVGRQQHASDAMDPGRASALAAVLDMPAPRAELPPFFHQAYFWEALPPARLGRDGHPARGPFIPDLGLPRRMWAGGRLSFHRPLHAGQVAEKTSEIIAVEEKTGQTGRLAFLTLRHEIRQDGALAVTEEQDLVYRAEHTASAPTPRIRPAPEDAAPRLHRFDPVLLFRYSALTHNGHRIHYDHAYATGTEGYGGIVTHGPLLAQLMMLRAAESGPLAGFTFRAVRPLLASETATICQDGASLWVRNASGALNMTAEATWL
ncbi:MAG: MaoC family dehydratase N-terminal domain-containing protein [Pseudomonadota bacterium]